MVIQQILSPDRSPRGLTSVKWQPEELQVPRQSNRGQDGFWAACGGVGCAAAAMAAARKRYQIREGSHTSSRLLTPVEWPGVVTLPQQAPRQPTSQPAHRARLPRAPSRPGGPRKEEEPAATMPRALLPRSLGHFGGEALRPEVLWHRDRGEVLPPHLLRTHKPHQPRILFQPLQAGRQAQRGGEGAVRSRRVRRVWQRPERGAAAGGEAALLGEGPGAEAWAASTAGGANWAGSPGAQSPIQA